MKLYILVVKRTAPPISSLVFFRGKGDFFRKTAPSLHYMSEVSALRICRKITAALLAVVLTVTCLACPIPAAGEAVEAFTDYAAVGRQISESLADIVWQPDNERAYNHLAAKSGDSFLWSYGSLLEGLGARVTYDPDDASAVAEYKKALRNVLNYEANNLYDKYGVEEADYLALNCLPNNVNTEVFYDDDIWIQKEFLNAYNSLGNPEYLDLARRVMNYIYRGWDDKFDGGIYWKDTGYGGTSGKNTCINAPAAMASCKMYMATGEQRYLDWAIKIYNWMNEKLVDPEDHLLWDNIDYDSEGGVRIDKAKFTYNSGCYLSAAVLLYEITGEEAYLTSARATAASSLSRWLYQKEFPQLGETAYAWNSDHTWFNSSLVEGFLNLERVAGDKAGADAVRNSLAAACLLRGETEAGWLPDNWQSSEPVSLEQVSVLQQAASVRTLFLIADSIGRDADPVEVIESLSHETPGSAAYAAAVRSAMEAYYAAPAKRRKAVSNLSELQAALQTLFGGEGEAVFTLTGKIAAFYCVTHQTEAELKALQAAYAALSDVAKVYVTNADLLTVLLEKQEELFDSFDLTVTGWAEAGLTPWLSSASDRAKEATRTAVAEEIYHQYRDRQYRMGLVYGSYGLGGYSGILGMQMDRRPNDNLYNPWGHANRRWAYTVVPFSGMAFSITGYFANAYPLPIGNSFAYNGNVYQVYMNTIRYYAETPYVVGSSVQMQTLDRYPGSGENGDAAARTFAYSYALYGQEGKRALATLGIPTGNVQTFGEILYQKYEGPEGTAYLLNTAARIASAAALEEADAAFEDTVRDNRAFTLSGDLAKAFLALGESGTARLAVTGAPVAQEADGAMLFEKGVLTAAGFTETAYMKAVETVNAAIAAIPPTAALTLADRDKVEAARVAYDALDDMWKPKVSAYDKLVEAEAQLLYLQYEADCRAAALPVNRQILALGEIGLSSRPAVEAARAAYDALDALAQRFVETAETLLAAEARIHELFDTIDRINAIIASLPEEITYRNGPAVRSALADYGTLRAAQRAYVRGYARLTAAMTALKADYASFGITVTGWAEASATPWMDSLTEAEREATRAAIADEVKYQYVENGYNVGVVNGGRWSVGNYSGIVGIQTEARPNDNVGNPWGSAERRWSTVVSPFGGTAFSVCGYFSRHFRYEAAIGNAFLYNGVVYQQYLSCVYSYADQPLVDGGSAEMSAVRSFPGYDGRSDVTGMTFRHAYALYGQAHKWKGETLGIPAANAVAEEWGVYQKFEGPAGAAYLLNTAERISAANREEEQTIAENTAFVLTGGAAEAFAALGDSPLARTGRPLIQREDGILFENGLLTADGFFEKGTPEWVVGSLTVSISAGMVTEGEDGLRDITWNGNIYTMADPENSAGLLNGTEIAFLAYGAYFGISEGEINRLMSGNVSAAARQEIFAGSMAADAEEIDIYARFGFRLRRVSAGASRTAVFFLRYRCAGREVLLLSTADWAVAYLE